MSIGKEEYYRGESGFAWGRLTWNFPCSTITFLSDAPLAPLGGALDGEPPGATFLCGALRGFQAFDLT